MNNSINIFLISTPLQLINAIEARHHFNLANSDAIIIINAYATNLTSIQNLLNNDDWASIIYVESSVEQQKEHESNLKNYKLYPVIKKLITSKKKLDSIISSVSKIRYLFVGYYLSLENLHFINSTSHEQIVLLDDGIATIEINRRRRSRQSLYSAWSIEFFVKALMKRVLFGYKLYHPDRVTYFSIYKIDVPQSDKLICNNYGFIRQQIGLKSQSQIAYLLGQPLSEINPKIIEEEKYLYYVERIIEHLRPLRVIYIPHRDEDKSKVTRMINKLGIEILEIQVPFEWFLIHSIERPSKVAGLVTSALPNCKSLFGGEIEFISFKMKGEDYIRSGIIQSITGTYQYFEGISDDNFRVISL